MNIIVLLETSWVSRPVGHVCVRLFCTRVCTYVPDCVDMCVSVCGFPLTRPEEAKPSRGRGERTGRGRSSGHLGESLAPGNVSQILGFRGADGDLAAAGSVAGFQAQGDRAASGSREGFKAGREALAVVSLCDKEREGREGKKLRERENNIY